MKTRTKRQKFSMIQPLSLTESLGTFTSFRERSGDHLVSPSGYHDDYAASLAPKLLGNISDFRVKIKLDTMPELDAPQSMKVEKKNPGGVGHTFEKSSPKSEPSPEEMHPRRLPGLN